MTMKLSGATRARWVLLLRVAFWLALAFAVTMALLPKPPPVLGEVGDKYQHMLAFSCLTVLASLGYGQAPPLRIAERLSFVGALIEVLQSIPALHRDCQIMDWVADTAAILVTLAIMMAVRKRLSL
jgi:VanZ family protein